MNESYTSGIGAFWWVPYLTVAIPYLTAAISAWFAAKVIECLRTEHFIKNMGPIINPKLRALVESGELKPPRYKLHAVGYGVCMVVVGAYSIYMFSIL